MISQTLLVSLLFCLVLVDQVNAICNLCGNGVDAIKWPTAILDSTGATCASKAVEIAQISSTSQCNSEVSKYSGTCCGNSKPTDVKVSASSTPTYNGPTGDNSICNICRDGNYPGDPSMVINVLYLGVGTCKQYWGYGQGGLIPNYLCDPIRYFAYDPCGCGSGSSNNQAPQQNGRDAGGNGSSGGSGSTTTIAEHKAPDNYGKDNMKLGNQGGRGGAGGVRVRRRAAVRGVKTQ